MKANSCTRHHPKLTFDAGGFSLLELVIAMGVFLVVGGTALTLYSRHQALLSQEQGTAGLNIGLRNALSQIQMDAVNAGYGLLLGANVPAWPVGITIYNSNPTAAQCNPTGTDPATYAAACFDQLSIVMADANTPAVQPSNSCSSPLNTTTATSVSGTPSNNSAGQPYSEQTYYTNYKAGDQVLFVNSAGSQYTPAVLTANATCPSCTSTSGNVSLSFTTGWTARYAYTAGEQIVDSHGNLQLVVAAGTSGSATPTWSTSTSSTTTDGSVVWQYGGSTDIINSFCSTDWILRLTPINYSVSVATATDPQLIRTQASASSVVMDQVIGFKVGAAYWNSTTSTFQYDYLTTDYTNNFSLVRAVRVSLIGRTAPSTDPSFTYRNPFDNGRYQIRGNSIIVNPRNLTMNND